MDIILPPYMKRRHEALRKVYNLVLSKKIPLEKMFDSKKTIHADLDLSWASSEIQDQIGTKEDYDIVIATIKQGQVSDAHLHEIGSSSFIVLGPKVGLPVPANLMYKTGELLFPSGEIKFTNEIKLEEGMELDIPSNQVHQFENKSDIPAQVLIIAHPIICTKPGDEDIHFVLKK